MEKRNGHAPLPVPEVLVSDYDENVATPPPIAQPPVFNESEEEDREIIESLTRAHATNDEVHVDVDGRLVPAPNAARRQESGQPLTPSAERHFDVDGMRAHTSNAARRQESTKHLTSNAERHVDMEWMRAQASHSAKREVSTKENVRPAATATKGSPKRIKQEVPSDDEIADMEVSRITSSLESKKFSPMNSSILKRPTASFAPAQISPVKLPDVSEISVPRLVPRRKEVSFNNDRFELPPMIFQPLREMSFSGESSRYNEDEGLATNGARKLKNRRTDRLYVESESDSTYSNGSSPDERPPVAWRTQDGASKDEEINQILSSFHVVESSKEEPDDNRPSTSKNIKKQDSSKGSRKSKD